MTFKNNNLRFIDSLSFVAKPLRDFPKIFSIEEDAKGFFPHHFNTPEHQDYIGPMPDKHFYGPENMTPGVHKEFNEWYATQAGYSKQVGKTLNFQEERDKYCSSDVKVLAMGVLKFKQIFYGQFDVDPFRYIAISSLCLNLYLTKFMPPDTIVSQMMQQNQYRRCPGNTSPLKITPTC